MKKCPSCGKEFEDSMKFCQVDGTELNAAEPAFDPYATVVGHKLDLTPLVPESTPTEEVIEVVEANIVEVEPLVDAPSAEIHETTGSIPIEPPNEVLDLPGADPLKTMYVSEKELKEALSAESSGPQTPAEEPIFEAQAPPPSPFSVPESPAEESMSSAPVFAEVDPSVPTSSSQFGDPFPTSPVAEWTPPSVPDSAWQGQEVASNEPLQPQAAVDPGPSKGMALGSLICGILSCTLCSLLGLFLGPVAIGTGFVAKKRADENPSKFGGRGPALGGMITGAIGSFFGILIIIYVVYRFFIY